MHFDYTDKVNALRKKLSLFMDEHVYPIEKEYQAFVHQHKNHWTIWPGMEELKEKAKAAAASCICHAP